jgi:predicted nucleotidyltransferase
MDKERILVILREHEPELKAAGLLHLRLFGSVARGEDTPESDVDLLFDYDESQPGNLVGAYGFEDRITEILGVKAHLSSAKYMRPRIRDRVLQEAVRAF